MSYLDCNKQGSADIRATICGSIAFLHPWAESGRAWLLDNVAVESWQWYGGAVACEPRMLADIIDAATADGLEVEE